MAMDLTRIIEAAAKAALDDHGPDHQAANKKPKDKGKGLTAPRALLVGAGVFTVGRLLVGSRGRDVLGDLQERLAAYESEHFGGESDGGDEEPEEDEEFDDEPEGEFDEDEEPEGEFDGDEEPEGEYDEDEEPEGEYDEGEEPEGEYDEDEEPEAEYDDAEEPEDEDEPEPEDEDEERPRRRRTSSAGSRNGRH